MEDRSIGRELKSVSVLLKRRLNDGAARSGIELISGAQGLILNHLFEQRYTVVCQKDIEQAFDIRRSTVSGVLSLMEKNGLIERASVPGDARLKCLRLTAKGLRQQQLIRSEIMLLEQQIRRGLGEAELAVFFGVMDKIRANLQEEL
ncbi:MAG: MarR family transcriptional regulator [Bacillota bacterium]|nr:MarR family transcriptional regulator [Bacillota bacterium]